MGIKDLLRFMKPYIVPIHIKKYSGKRVGIDAYSWLHKGAYSCSMELAMSPESKKGKQYLSYFMHRINLLRHHKVTPVVVFDGGHIPCKSATEGERRRKRAANLALAKDKLNQGDVAAAVEFFKRAVHITPTIAHQLIQIFRSENVEFVVAPYEADAQLAYMSSLAHDKGGIAAVITEDSDLMAYGCKAVIFKMDRYGNGEEIVMDNVFNSVDDGLSFRHFDLELFTGMCILAGCDFLPSVPGIGIKRAYSLVSKYRNLDRALSVLEFDKGNVMPEDYVESFKKALAVFHHARIYDTEIKVLKPMKPLPTKLQESLGGDLDILGPDLPSSMAIGIAEGCLDPITKEAFDCFLSDDGQLVPVSTQISYSCRQVPQSQVSRQESCFSIFSSIEKTEEKATGSEQATLGSIKYSKEALALRKLVFPTKSCQKEEKVVERTDFPNNNPFKKRKLEDVDSNSVVIDAEISGSIFSAYPESQESVNSKAVTKSGIRKDRNDKTPKAYNKSKTSPSKKSSITQFFMRVSS